MLAEAPYPTDGVTVAINHHPSTVGKHRIRFYFPPDIAQTLRRGLSWPRLHIDGSTVNGMRVWCTEEGGLAPALSKAGSWAVTLPARRLRAREEVVNALPVPVDWDRDDTGPVLLLPRLPDPMLPEAVIEKLPNSQVDQSTIMERADKRLQRDLREIYEEAVEAKEAEPPPEPEPIEPPTPTIVDLKDALSMVNELIDQLGDSVVLSIDETGHVRAKRRVVQFIDL